MSSVCQNSIKMLRLNEFFDIDIIHLVSIIFVLSTSVPPKKNSFLRVCIKWYEKLKREFAAITAQFTKFEQIIMSRQKFFLNNLLLLFSLLIAQCKQTINIELFTSKNLCLNSIFVYAMSFCYFRDRKILQFSIEWKNRNRKRF